MSQPIVFVLAFALMVQTVSGCSSAMSLIEQAEGFRATAYMDTTGHKTVCYGFNMDASGAEAEFEAAGGDWNSVYYNGGSASQQLCATLLSKDVQQASSQELGIFGDQGSCINAVLTDMTYNLGAAGMASFTTFIGLIKSHQWQAASNDLAGTLWCSQVKSRCTRDRAIIAAGPGAHATTQAGHTTTASHSSKDSTPKSGGSSSGGSQGGSGSKASSSAAASTGASTGAPTTGAATGAPTTGAATGAPTTGAASGAQTTGADATGVPTATPEAPVTGDDNDEGSGDSADSNAQASTSSSSSDSSASIGIGVGVGVGAGVCIVALLAVLIIKRRREAQRQQELREKLVEEEHQPEIQV